MSSAVIIPADVRAKFEGQSYTDEELKTYVVQRTNLFRGTIAIAVIYGVFALLLLLLAMFYAPGRQLLGGDLLPFVVTFTGGVFVIVGILIFKIYRFVPISLNITSKYSKDLCPDYWKLVPANSTDVKNADLNEDISLLKYKCVPDTNVYQLDKKRTAANAYTTLSANDTSNVYGHSVTRTSTGVNAYYTDLTDTDTTSTTLKNTLNNINIPRGGLTNGNDKAFCDVVFPNYMAAKETNGGNALRCKYAEKCGIPWTAAGCSL